MKIIKTIASIVGAMTLWGASQLIGPHPMPAWAAIHLYVLFAILLEVS